MMLIYIYILCLYVKVLTFEAPFMKKLRSTEAELKKCVSC